MATPKRKSARKSASKTTAKSKSKKTASASRRGTGRKRTPAQKRAQTENLQKGRKSKSTIRSLLGL